jgi:hypothetical protein
MLILDDLLFGLPVKGVKWVLLQLLEVAEREATDEQPVIQAILESELAFEEGRVDRAAYEADQALLMARLREIRETRRRRAEEAAAAAAGEAPRAGPISGKASIEVDVDFESYGKGS